MNCFEKFRFVFVLLLIILLITGASASAEIQSNIELIITERISVSTSGTQGNGNSYYGSFSADSSSVIFISDANNLVPGDTNNAWDVFKHDRQIGVTTRISVASDGTQGNNGTDNVPSISANGRYVVFSSSATNLVPGDTNGFEDVFVHDLITGETTRVSVSSDGSQGNKWSLSQSFFSISADGRYIIFQSDASNLVPGDTNQTDDIFLHDQLTGETTRVSVSSYGTQGNGTCSFYSISADGRYIVFDSFSSNLVPGDTNGTSDIFLHDRLTGITTLISVNNNGVQGNDGSLSPSISADGRFVTFWSWATNLVPGDTNGFDDVFVRDL
jgi:Tol biopolymer transport system component